ncbi:hypothetical protein [Cytobacillus firmus]|uniref:hypothetical protein n=1 Tax=Cytobacillus firmus TaxID=1399 RepID=UPI0030018420
MGKIRKRREAAFSQNDKINKKGGELKENLYSKLKKMNRRWVVWGVTLFIFLQVKRD